MNYTLVSVAALSGGWSLVLVDSAVKGTALLVLAALAAGILRRDSAATRYLVWLLAIVAMLAMPALSSISPQWRVLPRWAGVPPKAVTVETSPPSIARPADGPVDSPRNAEPAKGEWPSPAANPSATTLSPLPPEPVVPKNIPEATVSSWNWSGALLLVWAIGFCLLILRLLAARWMLWNVERQATVLCSSRQSATANRDTIATALEAARLQLGIRHPVAVLIHPDKTIPMVWGVLRDRLLLPAAARSWSGDQLRSALLHELAHIKRGDMLGYLLAQIACALHWFNPLVWLAAWRLGVERERACDDLVLASGVRPSVYAEHLLDAATRLSAVRWTRACDLVMARKASLEGRLIAVLSENRNRRVVSAGLAAIALAITVGVAVPTAMLHAADEGPGAEPKPAATGTQPTGGEKLDPDTEKRLRWGEPAGGLRAAIAVRPAPVTPKASDFPNELYLAVQNVSTAPIRLSDTTAAPELRMLYLKIDGRLVTAIGTKEPTGVDVTLQPREAVFLLVFAFDGESKDRPTAGSIEAGDLLKEPNRTLYAKMHIANALPGAWTGTLVTGETSGEAAAGKPQPKGKEAQALFRQWQDSARTNGNIPGGALGSLARVAANFVKFNPTDERAPKIAELIKRIDTSHDWTPAEAVALLDEVTAIYAPLPSWAVDEPLFSLGGAVQTGRPLPADLANAPWDQPSPDGLRVAWLLEPRAEQHRLGTPLKSRILFHNSGKNTVVFRALTWYQSARHKARDANGADIAVDSTHWTTIPRIVACRLAPGEFIEVTAAGIGVGPMENFEDWQNTRVGSWVKAKAGDEVTFIPGPVSLYGRHDDLQSDAKQNWWLDFIKDRLSLDIPLPAEGGERRHLLDRAVRNLFGTTPTTEETAAFVADRAPDAFDALAKRLAQRAGVSQFTGMLQSGETKYRVLPADPDAAKKPRIANNPGRYTLREGVVLAVSRRPDGERLVNEASIQFSSPDPSKPVPGEPYKLRLPDGYGTWAAAWVRGGTVLWLQDKGGVRSYNVSNPAKVKEDIAELDKVPREIREALRGALPQPAPPASVRP